MYVAATFAHLVLRLYKNKNLRFSFEAYTLMTDKSYLYHARVPREEFLRWSCNEACITIRWDTASSCARNSRENAYSLFFLGLFRLDKRLDTKLYFIANSIHTEIKPQAKVNHDMNSQALTPCTTYD